MKYLSLCSGIEAATVAWHPLGWEAVAYSEIERFPSEVLAHHYPHTPNLGDMTKFKEWNLESNVDLLVGGTPCQSFSVAGLRKGLDDPRGNLMLTYLAIARQYSPRWLVWENVPGVLSSNRGLDFASLLRGMGELGYGFAYRVLDAQYFGVAQRRRRVFVVGYLGDWRAAAAVLFERHSLQGHPAPSREKREGVAASTRAGASVGSLCARTGQSISVQDAAQGHLMPIKHWPADISSTLDTTFGTKQGLENQHINAGCPMFVPAQPVYEMHGQDSRVRDLGETCSTVTSKWGTGGGNVPVALQAIALAENTIGRQPHNGGNGDGFTDGGPMYTLNATGVHGVAQPIAYAFDSLSFNSMKSANPISGCNEVDVSKTLDTSRGLDPSCNQGGIGVAQPMAICLGGQHPNAGIGIDQSPTLTEAMGAGGGHIPIMAQPVGTDIYNGNITGDVAVPLTNRADGTGTGPTVMQSMAVRRLTPTECERLQGFPDNYTDIKSKNKPTPDGPRYKALGNSMAVPVMAWIGQRIEQVEAICKQNK